MLRTRKQLFAVLICGICFSVFLLADASGYHLLKKIPVVNSEGTWDFASIDESARRLYVAHETQVDVLDVDKETVVGKIPGAQGAHGIAIAPDLGTGFITNGDGAFVMQFDLKTLRVLKTIPTGNLPDAIVVTDASAQEHTLPRAQITSMQPLPTSLMPAGLDHTLTEEELLDLVAYLRSCR